jgi:Fur family ferric uptake transcriptional regulator
MEEESLEYKAFLNQHGIKSTKQRNLLLKLLNQSNELLTADTLYLKVLQEDNTMNLSTIYRILDLFTKKQIIQKSNFLENTTSVFELKRLSHQHHLICLNCKKIIYIDHCPLEKFEKSLESKTNFLISDHKLELYGYCGDCKKNLHHEIS